MLHVDLEYRLARAKEIKTSIMGFGSLAKAPKPTSLVRGVKKDLQKALRSYGRL